MPRIDLENTELPAPSMRISPKRNRFAEEYIVDHNATQAYIRAGYSERSAKTGGSRLLTNADVRARVAELEAWLREVTAWTYDRLMAQLEEDHALFRLDPKSAHAAVRTLENIGRLAGLIDDKGGSGDDRKSWDELGRLAAEAHDAEEQPPTKH